eukprot:1284651-Amphidinium_carterae.1
MSDEGCAHLHKVAGVANPADLLSKPAIPKSKSGPKAHEAEVQWTRLEKGRLFSDFGLRGRALAGVLIANLTSPE